MTIAQKIQILLLADEVNKGKARVSLDVSKAITYLTVFKTCTGNSIKKGDNASCAMFYDYATIVKVLTKMKEQTERI
jgi:hypothetical protein